MFCTTIIPTIGRTTLARAVESVLQQTTKNGDFEVIVVNDSGRPLPEAEWQRAERVSILNTNRRERSIARNTGAAIAQGTYLHFLDDDDWLLPGAFQSLGELASRSGDAVWLYGGSQLVDRDDQPIVQLHHGLEGNCFVQLMAGEWIPLQSSLIRSDAFIAIGGFNTLISAAEDVDLGRRLAKYGDLKSTQTLISCIEMGQNGSSTDVKRHPHSRRLTREALLDQAGTFARLNASADVDRWRGRVVRTYLTSAYWNLQQRNPYTAMHRMFYAFAAYMCAWHQTFTRRLWHQILTNYESETFKSGFVNANPQP